MIKFELIFSFQPSTKIDQAKILETARKNVLKMMKSGTMPEGLPVENLKKEQMISIQAGGKSVQELTGLFIINSLCYFNTLISVCIYLIIVFWDSYDLIGGMSPKDPDTVTRGLLHQL